MLRIILTVVQVFASFAIVGLVLLQRGKGADAGAGFGAGASGTVFGARGATTALSRATAIFAAIFMINSLALAYMGTRQAEQPRSILDEAARTLPKSVPNAPAKSPLPGVTSAPKSANPVVPVPSPPPAPGSGSAGSAPNNGGAPK